MVIEKRTTIFDGHIMSPNRYSGKPQTQNHNTPFRGPSPLKTTSLMSLLNSSCSPQKLALLLYGNTFASIDVCFCIANRYNCASLYCNFYAHRMICTDHTKLFANTRYLCLFCGCCFMLCGKHCVKMLRLTSLSARFCVVF